MDYSELGVEGCVNGVWGRVKNGYFYNLVEEGTNYPIREIDVNSEYGKYFAIMCNHDYENLTCRASHQPVLKAYVPEHIRALGNIKKGDLVWAQTISNAWLPVMFDRYCELTGQFVCTFLVHKESKTVIESTLFRSVNQTCPLLD